MKPPQSATRECCRCRRKGIRLPAVIALLGIIGSGSSLADEETIVAAPTIEAPTTAPADERKQGSWVFVPIPVANPTVGNGAQLGALYLHAPSGDGPPATSGLGLMATDNGTRLVAAFHDQSLRHDRFRLTGFIAGGRLEAQYFGVGTGSIFADHPVKYGFEGEALAVLGLVRVVDDADWFVGLSLQQAAATIRFDVPDVIGALPDLQGKLRIFGGGPQVQYDARDDKTYPTRGEDITFRWFGYQGSWGREPTFRKADADFRLYRSITSDLVGAVRARFQGASDQTPFFALPSMDVRGVSADRYRDYRVISTSAELRYVLAARWGLLAFVDAGRAAATTSELGAAKTIVSYGGAVRWQPSAARRLYLGLNVAFSTDASAVFIQVGETF
jgi:hypothetical protein